MLKKLLIDAIRLRRTFCLSFAISLAIILPVFADENFNQMNPTVKITSYKKLFTEQIIAFGSGSGTVINSDGLILTNHHVVFEDNEQKPFETFEICITFDVQKEPVCKYTAKLVANDKDLDIALLKINRKDVFGKTIPNLKYLNYHTNATPKEESIVQVIGYPGSGGETITITRGQISGFDTYNEYKYFKTDTDFDHGSSGGTALDEDGNFIGIPTYIRSYAENVGYFLDLREALPWIKEHRNDNPVFHKKVEERLIMELARLKKANDNKTHAYEEYPGLSIKIPKNWRFIEINDDSLYAEQEKLTDPVGLSIYLNYFQFPVDEGYLDKLDEELAKVKEQYPDYKKEKVKFNGYDAWKLTYSYFNQHQYAYYIPYGYTLVSLNYVINLDEEEKQTKAIEEALKHIKITSGPQDNPELNPTITFKEPLFSITMANNWRIQKNKSNQPMDLLAEAVQKDNFDGYIYIYYRQIPKDERGLSTKDRLDETTKNLAKLIYKKEDVVLDGLEGYLYTNEYEGDKYQEMHKKLTITLPDNEYEFIIQYDDLSDNFDKNLPGISKILKSFTWGGEDLPKKGQYEFGSLNYRFSDIQYHRFASAISSLADKEIIQGYPDGSFKPEKLVSRAEALKIILGSKNNLEKKRGLGKEVDFGNYLKEDRAVFRDIKKADWFNTYIHYGHEKKLLEGYPNKTFRPHQSVNLAEAIKMITGVYEIPVWQGETKPWYKKYMDKGYELGLIPSDMDNPSQKLTRAELSFIVNRVYKQAK